MARPRNPIPSYRHHRQTGKAIIDIYTAEGRKTSMLLPGPFGSAESKSEYQRVLAILEANGGRYPAKKANGNAGDVLIAELILRFMAEKVEVDYVYPDGTPTNEVTCYRQAFKPLGRLYGSTIARDFDAAALKIVRQSMIAGSWMNDDERKALAKRHAPMGWSRGYIRMNLFRIRSMFRWAVENKIVGAEVVTSLECLAALKPGRGGARETEPVVPVAEEVVENTLPFLPVVVRAMVQFQLLTGCRPGEMCNMRAGDIDRTESVWLYKPRSHKTARHGHLRCIAIGPKAQMALRPYLKDDPDAFLFSPAEQRILINRAKREARKTKVQPSQTDRRKVDPARSPKGWFTTTTYNRAIRRACTKAKVPSWHAHQLRHTAALLIEREHGAEAARAVLGHRTLNMTLHYSGIDTKRASDVAAKVG